MHVVISLILLLIGTKKNIKITINENIIPVPKSGCKNISIKIPTHIIIGKNAAE